MRVAGDGDLVATDRGPARICADGFFPALPGPLAIDDAGTVAFTARLCADGPGARDGEGSASLGWGVFTAEPLLAP
ncbi:MAG: hypothetical protein AAF772_17535 [Acidobacteriota bacterium]